MENKFTGRKQNPYQVAFVVVLIIVLLTSCVFVSSLLAWLKDRDNQSSEGEITIGTVEFEIYSGDSVITTNKRTYEGDKVVSEITMPFEITGNSTIRSVDLKIRNTGTVSALMRVTIQLYYNYDNKLICLKNTSPTLPMEADISNTGWVNDFKGGVLTGYSYYNDVINPYTIRSKDTNGNVVSEDRPGNAVSVMSQILVPTVNKNGTYYVVLTVEGVASSGNIYKKEFEGDTANIPDAGAGVYPFGPLESIPAGWTAWKK